MDPLAHGANLRRRATTHLGIRLNKEKNKHATVTTSQQRVNKRREHERVRPQKFMPPRIASIKPIGHRLQIVGHAHSCGRALRFLTRKESPDGKLPSTLAGMVLTPAREFQSGGLFLLGVVNLTPPIFFNLCIFCVYAERTRCVVTQIKTTTQGQTNHPILIHPLTESALSTTHAA